MEKFLVGEGNFPWRDSWIFRHFKKMISNKIKTQVFFLKKIRSNNKLKTNRKYYVCEMDCLHSIGRFYALVSYLTFKRGYYFN